MYIRVCCNACILHRNWSLQEHAEPENWLNTDWWTSTALSPYTYLIVVQILADCPAKMNLTRLLRSTSPVETRSGLCPGSSCSTILSSSLCSNSEPKRDQDLQSHFINPQGNVQLHPQIMLKYEYWLYCVGAVRV